MDSRGYVWLGTDSGIVTYNGKIFRYYDTSSGLKNNIIYDIAEDKNGTLHFATYGGGVVVRQPDGSFKELKIEGDELANRTNALLFDEEYLWIGSDYGVACKKGEETKHFELSLDGEFFSCNDLLHG